MAMQAALFEYLLHHGKLPLSGMGTFYQEELPARLDFAARQLHAPVPVLRFALENSTVENRLYDFIARSFQETQADAMRRYNDFCYQLKQRLNDEGRVQLAGLGTLEKAFLNTYTFQAAMQWNQQLPPVAIERVIRQSSEAAATEVLAQQPVVARQAVAEDSQWMLWAVVLVLLSAATIAAYWWLKGPV